MNPVIVAHTGLRCRSLLLWPVIAILLFLFFLLPSSFPASADHCVSGLVWREAFPGDIVCVHPDSRDQAAGDNAAARSRIAPCEQGFVPRGATRSDRACVTIAARDQASAENRENLANTNLICDFVSDVGARCPRPAPCKSGFVHRQATPEDFVCASPGARDRVREENRVAASHVGVTKCKDGYIWRRARLADLVCVTVETFRQTQAENRAAAAGMAHHHRTIAQCHDYARTAVAQAEEYFLRGCGTRSDRWQTNYANHYGFCRGPDGDISERETSARAGVLSLCRTINPLPEHRGGQVSGTCSFSAFIRNVECLDSFGGPSFTRTPGSYTVTGCGRDADTAEMMAKLTAAAGGVQLVDTPTPNACTFTAATFLGCICQ